METSSLQGSVSPTGLRYAYVEQDGDVGVVGYGETMEQAFEAAAAALFGLTTKLSEVRPERTVPVSFIETDAEAALVRWLDLLLESAGRHRLSFSEFHLQRERTWWWGCATGEPRRGEGEAAVKLKRASPDMVAVKQTPRGWEARCMCVVERRGHMPPVRMTPGEHRAPVADSDLANRV